jgi:hypothetical protein
VLHAGDALQLVVPAATAEMVAVAPVLEAGGTSFAPLGLSRMFNGGGAVLGCSAHQASGGGGGGGCSFTVQVGGPGATLHSAGGGVPYWAQRSPIQDCSTQRQRPAPAHACWRSAPWGSRRAECPPHRTPARSPAPQVRGCGELLMYASRAPASVAWGQEQLPFEYTEGNGKLLVQVPQAPGLRGELQVGFA